MIFLALLTELYNHVFYRGEQASIKRGEQAFGEEGTGKEITEGKFEGIIENIIENMIDNRLRYLKDW